MLERENEVQQAEAITLLRQHLPPDQLEQVVAALRATDPHADWFTRYSLGGVTLRRLDLEAEFSSEQIAQLTNQDLHQIVAELAELSPLSAQDLAAHRTSIVRRVLQEKERVSQAQVVPSSFLAVVFFSDHNNERGEPAWSEHVFYVDGETERVAAQKLARHLYSGAESKGRYLEATRLERLYIRTFAFVPRDLALITERLDL